MIGHVARFFREGRLLQRILDVTGACLACKIWAEHVFSIDASSGPSMYPTLQFKDESLLVSRFHKYGKGVGVGDVVVIRYPFLFRHEVGKRVLGLPGDYVLRGEPFGNGSLGQGEDAEMIQVLNRQFISSQFKRDRCSRRGVSSS